MPFFLSDEFKSILDEKIKGTGGPSDGRGSLSNTQSLAATGGGPSGGSGPGNQMYKSTFLKDKVTEQAEKRKRERKIKKGAGPDGEQMPEHNLFGGKAGRGKKGAGFDDGSVPEEVQELIDDLKNDLKIRDMEFEELKEKFKQMEIENRRLKDVYQKERNERLVIEGKLKKTAIHSELKEASESITSNTFFEEKRSKLASINSTLLSTVISLLS